jgi:hypothetical protein
MTLKYQLVKVVFDRCLMTDSLGNYAVCVPDTIPVTTDMTVLSDVNVPFVF